MMLRAHMKLLFTYSLNAQCDYIQTVIWCVNKPRTRSNFNLSFILPLLALDLRILFFASLIFSIYAKISNIIEFTSRCWCCLYRRVEFNSHELNSIFFIQISFRFFAFLFTGINFGNKLSITIPNDGKKLLLYIEYWISNLSCRCL